MKMAGVENTAGRSEETITLEYSFHIKTGPSGVQHVRTGEAKAAIATPPGAVPRVTRLMALAIRFEGLVAKGLVKDYADLARLGRVTRARITQIMNLLNLAPDIQEAILGLPRTVKGRAPVTERAVRAVANEPEWKKQRRVWTKIRSHDRPPSTDTSEAPPHFRRDHMLDRKGDLIDVAFGNADCLARLKHTGMFGQ
jgi:hypothetical protein